MHRPSDRLDAVPQAEQSRALGRVRATTPVVANFHTKCTAVSGHRICEANFVIMPGSNFVYTPASVDL